MQKGMLFFKVLLLVLIALLGSNQGAFAEQFNSIKDCLEDESKCSEDQLKEVENNEETTTDNNEATPTVGLTFWDFLKMIFATIFVIALLYAVLKFINKRSRSFSSNQLVENLGGTALGTNRSIQIVKIGNRVLVVGVGEDVKLLKEIDDDEEARQIIEDYNHRMDQLVQPSDIVTKLIERTRNIKQGTSREETSFSSTLKAQLEELSKGRKKLFDEMEKKGSDKR
ncbi:flagellar biosynthetic protein FliO [Robertmurraya korlensis]|uniref:flagellar biosynthetic protein FliO n=1 Tax=Robertmurraya korlensis TaxID=519977 RepID=UPI00203CD80C|nr:flagellar biosynthetic protein FliO [Robertmurraya korlensis]MCM3600177.1 flagellar biosynthetic protein FliO [Robertmurraya korlensis]